MRLTGTTGATKQEFLSTMADMICLKASFNAE